MSIEKNKKKTQSIVTTALFAAIIVVLQLFVTLPPIGSFYITLSLVPIVLGAVLYGPLQGAVLGLVLGLCVSYQVINMPDPMSALMFQQTPFVTISLCLLKTTVAGYVSGLVYKVLSKKNKSIGVIVASALCPIINTGIFLTGLFTVYSGILNGQAAAAGKASGLAFVFAFIILTNFIPEFIINVLLSPVIVRVSDAVSKIIKR